jgi:predicted PhzF superfamily epimerase YddE/YHI9
MVIVTQMKPAESIEKLVIKTRMFAPGLGIDEDPVVGLRFSKS